MHTTRPDHCPACGSRDLESALQPLALQGVDGAYTLRVRVYACRDCGLVQLVLDTGAPPLDPTEESD
jgi:hypothetical protein